jgi:hypothetical protein
MIVSSGDFGTADVVPSGSAALVIVRLILG